MNLKRTVFKQFVIIAANYGHDVIVKILLEYYNFHDKKDDYSMAFQIGKNFQII